MILLTSNIHAADDVLVSLFMPTQQAAKDACEAYDYQVSLSNRCVTSYNGTWNIVNSYKLQSPNNLSWRWWYATDGTGCDEQLHSNCSGSPSNTGAPSPGECTPNWPINVVLTPAQMANPPNLSVNSGCVGVPNIGPNDPLYCVDHYQAAGDSKLCQYIMNGESATTEQTTATEDIGSNTNDETLCVTGDQGSVACYTPVEGNCGQFNGELICASAIQPGECASTPSGNVVCGESATAPINPDGTTKEPTLEVSTVDENGNVVSNTYFAGGGNNSGTTNNLLQQILDGQCGAPGQPACASEETIEDPTYTGAVPGDLYTPTTETYTTVLNRFKDTVTNSAVITAVDGYFTVTTGGTCPNWTLPSVWFLPAIPIDAQCSSAMEQVWPFIAAILIAVASWFSFRIAFL